MSEAEVLMQAVEHSNFGIQTSASKVWTGVANELVRLYGPHILRIKKKLSPSCLDIPVWANLYYINRKTNRQSSPNKHENLVIWISPIFNVKKIQEKCT